MPSQRLSKRDRSPSRSGFSLLEMVAAAALVTGTVVPALAVIRDAMAQSRDLHRQQLLANYAVQILEDQSAFVATNWTSATVEGDYTADGNGEIRYTLVRSDDPTDGGIVNRLMNLNVTVYDDTNANDTLDTNERREIYRTKVARLNSYENEEQ